MFAGKKLRRMPVEATWWVRFFDRSGVEMWVPQLPPPSSSICGTFRYSQRSSCPPALSLLNNSQPAHTACRTAPTTAAGMLIMTEYTDYASSSIKDDNPAAEGGIPRDDRESFWSNDSNFPFQLHYILHELEKEGKADIISWLPHGRGFRVHDKERFVTEVLATWFRQHKFTSFQVRRSMR